jgi:hypothetical protein
LNSNLTFLKLNISFKRPPTQKNEGTTVVLFLGLAQIILISFWSNFAPKKKQYQISKISKIQSRRPTLNPPSLQQSYGTKLCGQVPTHNQFIKVMKPFIILSKNTRRNRCKL